MPQFRFALALLAAALLNAACQPAADQKPAARASGAAEEREVPKGLFTLEPATLDSCLGAVVTLRWDIRRDSPSVSTVEIWIAAPGQEPKLFAAAGAAGETKTGPWAGPGQTFVIRDKATGKDLASATVLGRKCP